MCLTIEKESMKPDTNLTVFFGYERGNEAAVINRIIELNLELTLANSSMRILSGQYERSLYIPCKSSPAIEHYVNTHYESHGFLIIMHYGYELLKETNDLLYKWFHNSCINVHYAQVQQASYFSNEFLQIYLRNNYISIIPELEKRLIITTDSSITADLLNLILGFLGPERSHLFEKDSIVTKAYQTLLDKHLSANETFKDSITLNNNTCSFLGINNRPEILPDTSITELLNSRNTTLYEEIFVHFGHNASESCLYQRNFQFITLDSGEDVYSIYNNFIRV